MDNLYIDIGNTKTKINYKSNRIENYFWLLTKEVTDINYVLKNLPHNLKLSKVRNIYISSVVPKKTAIWSQVSKVIWDKKPILIEHKLKTNIKYNIDNIDNLGSDLLALSALINTKNSNSIIVNLGTATTILHVKNGILEGAIISPGLKSSFKEIIKGTSLLSEVNLKISKNKLGKNTSEALSIGLLQGHYQMIKGLINTIDSNAIVYISGGDYIHLESLSNFIYIKEATIEGMKVIAKLNEE